MKGWAHLRPRGVNALIRHAFTLWNRGELRPCHSAFLETRASRAGRPGCCLVTAAFLNLSAPGTTTTAHSRDRIELDVRDRFGLTFEQVRSLARGFDRAPPDPDFTDRRAYNAGVKVRDELFRRDGEPRPEHLVRRAVRRRAAA